MSTTPHDSAAATPAGSDAEDAGPSTGYRVRLDTFHGPMDLLLHLIRKREVDIWDIPIAQIAEDYMEYVKAMQEIDLEDAGDFLVMAATLLEIKAQMLIPAIESESQDDDDPRLGLVRQLLEYKRFQDLAQQLQSRGDDAGLRHVREGAHADAVAAYTGVADGEEPDPELEMDDVSQWDLLREFQSLMRETQLTSLEITFDERPIEVVMQELEGRLKAAGELSFRDAFEGAPDRGRLIAMFLAMLELVHQRRCRVKQDAETGRIYLTPRDPSEDPPPPEPEPEGEPGV